jgi:uncharacterized protein (TIGR02996 family)
MDLRRDLEQQIAERPDDWGPWLVYTDWMIEQIDDPRLELIRLSHRLATEPMSKADARKLERLRMSLDSEDRWRCGLKYGESIYRLTLQHGYVRTATFGGRYAGQAFVELCKAGEAWLLQEVVFEPTSSEDMAILAASKRLRGFQTMSGQPGVVAARWASDKLLDKPEWFEWAWQRLKFASFPLFRASTASSGTRAAPSSPRP